MVIYAPINGMGNPTGPDDGATTEVVTVSGPNGVTYTTNVTQPQTQPMYGYLANDGSIAYSTDPITVDAYGNVIDQTTSTVISGPNTGDSVTTTGGLIPPTSFGPPGASNGTTTTNGASSFPTSDLLWVALIFGAILILWWFSL